MYDHDYSRNKHQGTPAFGAICARLGMLTLGDVHVDAVSTHAGALANFITKVHIITLQLLIGRASTIFGRGAL